MQRIDFDLHSLIHLQKQLHFKDLLQTDHIINLKPLPLFDNQHILLHLNIPNQQRISEQFDLIDLLKLQSSYGNALDLEAEDVGELENKDFLLL